jgi:hypothetical protein
MPPIQLQNRPRQLFLLQRALVRDYSFLAIISSVQVAAMDLANFAGHVVIILTMPLSMMVGAALIIVSVSLVDADSLELFQQRIKELCLLAGFIRV